MQQLTDEGRRIIDDVARRHGFSSDAVTTMLIAVSLCRPAATRVAHGLKPLACGLRRYGAALSSASAALAAVGV